MFLFFAYRKNPKEEQKLCKEVEMEKAKVQDSLKELMEFWGDVTAKMS